MWIFLVTDWSGQNIFLLVLCCSCSFLEAFYRTFLFMITVCIMLLGEQLSVCPAGISETAFLPRRCRLETCLISFTQKIYYLAWGLNMRYLIGAYTWLPALVSSLLDKNISLCSNPAFWDFTIAFMLCHLVIRSHILFAKKWLQAHIEHE